MNAFPIVKISPEKLAAMLTATPQSPALWGTYTNSGKPFPSTYPNNRRFFPVTPLNQRLLGICSGFGITQFRAALLQQAGGKYVEFSELAQYYNERLLENTVDQDSGSSLADGFTVFEQSGAQFEDEDPFSNDYMIRFKERPTGKWFKEFAFSPGQLKYLTQDSSFLANVLDALGQGLIITLGMEVFNGIMSEQCAQTGVLPMPADNEQSIGGHWVNLFSAEVTDFNTRQGYVWAMNQWGQWGIGGAFKIPLAYIEKYVVDAVVGYPDKTLPVYPADPGPQPLVPHTYQIQAFWDKPQYVMGETAYFGCYLTQDGQPLSTGDDDLNPPFVAISSGDNGPVPTGPDGKSVVPWGASGPGTYSAIATWTQPDGTSITSAPADVTIIAGVPLPTIETDISYHVNESHTGIVYNKNTMVPQSVWSHAGTATQVSDNIWEVNGKNYLGTVYDGELYLVWTVMTNNGFTMSPLVNGKRTFTK